MTVTARRGAIELPMPARGSMFAHLAAEHTPIDRAAIDSLPVDELVAIHTGEHSTRDVPGDKRQPVHAGHLRHVHPDPKKATARQKTKP